MEIIRGIENINHIDGPSAVTVGVFDGVHIGHQAIIKKAVELARDISGKSVVVTFEPHPLAIVRPESQPPLLLATDLKVAYIEELGPDYLLIIPFTLSIANMEAEKFVNYILLEKLNARYIVVGEDFSFGKGRRGDVAFLRSYGKPKGLNVIAIPHIKKDDIIISSTEVREKLKKGDIQGVRQLTGRYPRFRGKVVRGFGRGGSVVGIPTANIETLYGELVPKAGVYAGYVWVGYDHLPCVIDIGLSPTFGDVKNTEIHVHILGFNKDIYGKTLDVELKARLRDETSFKDIEELKEHIRSDIRRAREVLAGEAL
ncbi:MAG: bifunctional riboflavin kinase/FAD synthetase [Actinobacteria bacterium]|nr:bifunctional riboflavin kinase/FAD synthetase [Actinomycetota bacterium]